MNSKSFGCFLRAIVIFRVSHAANELRQKVVGDEVKYAVNRNINYTNVCYFGCTFCAFSKGKTAESFEANHMIL